MSRHDSDLDHSEWLHGPDERPNMTCARCGRGFSAESFGIGMLCDRCCDQRDHDEAVGLEMVKRFPQKASA